MTEYKVGLKVIFNYLPLYVIEGALIYVASISGFYEWVMITLTSIILAITLFFSISQVFNRYELTDEGIKITYFNKKERMILFNDLVIVKKNRHSFEVGYRFKEKMKTIYFGWYIIDYRELELDFIDRVQKHNHYEDIIFIN